MEYNSTTGAASRRASGCIVVGVYLNGKLGVAAKDIDKASGGELTRLLKQGDLSANVGKCTVLRSLPGVRAERVAVVGLGKVSKYSVAKYRRALAAVAADVRRTKTRDICNYLTLEPVSGSDAYYLARYSVETIRNALYEFTQLKSGKKPAPSRIAKICHAVAGKSDKAKVERGARHADAIVEGTSLCRDLGNLPANICTPAYLAKTSQQLAKQYRNLTTKIVNEAEMKRLGMHSLLSVTAGAKQPAKLIVMQYKGISGKKPVVLVGKGITFDTGGISLKPGPGMDEMKFDMCGAASVIGTMKAVAELQLKVNLTVVVPTCENMPGQNATRPGDIVKSMSGQTIEILNTDAEGRLILCDALTYSKRFKPDLIVDIATLTGACVIALGHHLTAVMTRDDKIADEITSAGIRADDRAWQLPLSDDYAKQLHSNFADMANIGGREGGAITAACFLGKYTDGMNWAHLDIAGTAYRGGPKKGATGRPVSLLSELLLARANALP